MSCDACKRLTVEELRRRPCGYCRREATKGTDMSTRTFTLDEIRAALAKCDIHGTRDIESALLAAKPEVQRKTAPCECPHGEGPGGHCERCGGSLCSYVPVAAKPEAKTCESWCGSDDGSPECSEVHRCYAEEEDQSCKCSPACQEAGRPLNPAPAASPPACPEWCGTLTRDHSEDTEHGPNWVTSDSRPATQRCWCSPGCRDRAKAVPRDAVKVTVTRTGPPPNATWNGQDVYVPPASGGQPGVPDGWKLGEGWLATGLGECPSKHIRTDDIRIPAPFIHDDGRGYCRECATIVGAIVPAEPSRPEAKKHPSCEEWCGEPLADGKPNYCHAEACADLALPIAPPAPGNHPGTPESSDVIECKTGNFPYRWMRFVGEVQQGSNDKVTWVQTRPAPGNHPGTPKMSTPRPSVMPTMSREELHLARERANPSPRLPEDEAPGKPDEAPLSERIRANRPAAAQSFIFRMRVKELSELADEVEALESRLSSQESETRKVLRERGDAYAQLAIRDARIAYLEKRAIDDAADKAGAVLAERERCLAWTKSYGKVKRTLDGARAGIMGGAPAPSGGK